MSIKDELRQLGRLVRTNSFRFLDNDLLAPGTGMFETLGSALALLGALSLALSTIIMYKYVFWIVLLNPALPEDYTWPDKQYLIALSMLVTGFTYVISWDGLFPDRRDSMALRPLPIRMRTLFAAKVISIFGLLLLVVLATNIFSSVAFPCFMTVTEPGAPGLARYILIHSGAMFAASAFLFFSLLALEGVLINVLSYSGFQRLSCYFQLGLLFLFLFVFILIPNIDPPMLADPRNEGIIRWLPPYWFLGLYQSWLGNTQPVVQRWARYASFATLASGLLAAVMYALGYRNAVRKALEQPDVAPAHHRRRNAALWRLADRALLRSPAGRAVFHFVVRTIFRNKRNRLILAGYLSAGVGYVLADVALAFHRGGKALYSPTAALASVPIVVTFLLLVGLRVLFSMPVELKANWIFRMTGSGRFEEYRFAVRMVMFLVGVLPVAAVSLPACGYLWGWKAAAAHVVVVVLVALFSIELLLNDFPKLPFTCSYLPGKASLKTTFACYVLLFSAVTSFISSLEAVLLRDPEVCLYVSLPAWALLGFLIVQRKQDECVPQDFVYEESGATVLTLGLQN